jgi:cardiolipin synthase A/B
MGSMRRKRTVATRGNRVSLLSDGAVAYDEMLDAIDHAARQVLLEMYWFASDSVGQRFGTALSRAAQRGVETAVIYDAVGSIDSDEELFESMRERGVQVREFHPVKPWRTRFRFDRVRRRDHRKLLVIDGALAFTGGVNLADAWLDRAGAKGFRDDMARIDGPAAAELCALFHRTWTQVGAAPLSELPVAKTQGDVEVEVLGQNDLLRPFAIARAYARRIGQARARIIISNAYFIPSRKLQRALCLAAIRGVDVRVLMPREPDVPAVRVASQASWGALLDAGVQLFEYEGRVLHSKSATIDDEWSTVGTFNLDGLSVHFNQEVNVAIIDADFATLMRQRFENDLAQSCAVTAEDLETRTFGEKLLSRVLWLFRRFL